MPTTPLSGAAQPVQVVAGAGAGSGGAAAITATTDAGERGICTITMGPSTAAGGLATINFAGPVAGRGRISQIVPGSGMLAFGSLADPDIRPIVLTVYPAPPMTVSFQAVPIINGAQMVGFQIVASGALPAGGVYTFAWAVL